MPRPSQCAPCGLYEGCLYPEAIHCAETREHAQFMLRTKEREVPNQQYSTPDGSVWECLGSQGDGDQFMRVASPDGTHENDFSSKRLSQVISTYGPLSLHDPYAEELVHLVTTLSLVSYHSDHQTFAKRIQKQFRTAGLKLVLEGDE